MTRILYHEIGVEDRWHIIQNTTPYMILMWKCGFKAEGTVIPPPMADIPFLPKYLLYVHKHGHHHTDCTP